VETPTYYKATFWADHSTETDKIPKVRKNLHEQLFVCGLKCSKQYRKMPKHSSKAGAYKKRKGYFLII